MSEIDTTKRLVKSRSGLKAISLDEERTSPFELKEPFWVPDNESPSCSKCQAKFDFLTRRHHCRRCGNVFCSHCCDDKVLLPRMCFVDPVRVCAACSAITKKENEFYDKHLKALLCGANLLLDEANGSGTRIPVVCYLSKDQQEIVFDGSNNWQHDPINLLNLISIRIIGSVSSPGNSHIAGVVIRYLDFKTEEQELQFYVPDSSNRKQSVVWISALQKALKYITP